MSRPVSLATWPMHYQVLLADSQRRSPLDSPPSGTYITEVSKSCENFGFWRLTSRQIFPRGCRQHVACLLLPTDFLDSC
jgi:hypothetical protein